MSSLLGGEAWSLETADGLVWMARRLLLLRVGLASERGLTGLGISQSEMGHMIAEKAQREGLEALSRGVLGRAKAEAEQVLADAQAKADRLRLDAEGQADELRKRILERAARDAAEVQQQAAVRAQLEAQTLRLKHREKLLDSVFDAARARLVSVQQWASYSQIARQLVSGAVRSLGSESAHIRADAMTRSSLTEAVLREIEGDLGVHLEFGPELEHGTGVVAETPEGHRRFDNTLEARLARKQEALRAPVYHVLTGGKRS